MVNYQSARIGRNMMGGGDASKVMSRSLAEHMWERAFAPLDVTCGDGPVFALSVPTGSNQVRMQRLVFSLRDENGQTTKWSNHICNNTHCPPDATAQGRDGNTRHGPFLAVNLSLIPSEPRAGCARHRLVR